MIAMKFGGSSVESVAALERVIERIRQHVARRPVIIISAMGKTTRRLLAAGESAAAGRPEEAQEIARDLRLFHEAEARPLTPPGSLDATFDSFFGELDAALAEAATGGLSPRLADRIAGFGELLASAVLASALEQAGIASAHVDCRKVIVTDDQFTRAQPIYEETDRRLQETLLPFLEEGRVPVLGGYVGATRDGVTTTLGREGSDFSAAIVGAALRAEEIWLWTDVDGILTADPHLFPAARVVPELSFAEALELACSGSKKPHPGTLGPASRSGVPIRVLNTRRPEAPGTVIGPRTAPKNPAPPRIRSIACRDHEHLLRVTPLQEGDGFHIFRQRVLALCEQIRPALTVLGALEAPLPLALASAERLEEVRAALAGVAGIETVPGCTVITLVSEDLAGDPAFADRALEAARDFAPRLVLSGVAAPCVRFLIDGGQAAAVVADLHHRLLPLEDA
jgi:aspartate kinase